MRTAFLTGFAALGLWACTASEQVAPDGPVVTSADFAVIEGDGWVGTLTYLDYTSEERVSIPTTATVEIASPNLIKYTVSYPKEPWEDAKAKLKLSKSGRVFDGHPVVSREDLADGKLTFATEHAGEDNNEAVDIRLTYTLGSSVFSISKDVRAADAENYSNRNVYLFTR